MMEIFDAACRMARRPCTRRKQAEVNLCLGSVKWTQAMRGVSS